ncbi:MAG TPA: UDP-N-acetylmuramate dehydrogenase [Egibacteraceae bacterium]|nr:UDP-N-acetylmuramate dehydrogenase [Egibacteraceae bacterium]
MGEDDLLERLRSEVSGEIFAGARLAAHTTLRVGGPAAALVRASSGEDLAAVAGICAELGRGWLIVGRGSNLLIADEGWPGVAVMLGRGFRGVQVDGESVTAGAAEPMPVLAREVARRQLGGLAFGVAIPGSLGGAVRMNAGAHGRELADVLEWAEAARLASGGRIQRFDRAQIDMGYRTTSLPSDAVVVRARLRLRRADPDTVAAEMDEMRRWRRAHQPISEPSCGSVFRNPPGDSAGRLIDEAGMKGHRVGGAQVSKVHANFITTSPPVTASDVRQVIDDVQRAVRERHGVELVPEVVMEGFEESADAPARGGGMPHGTSS